MSHETTLEKMPDFDQPRVIVVITNLKKCP